MLVGDLVKASHTNEMNQRQLAKVKTKIETYNLIPGLIWTIVFAGPPAVFCYRHMPVEWFWMLLSLSLIPAFLPKTFFIGLQVSKSDLFYKKTGVNFIGQFTQNGKIVNRLIQKRFPGYKRLPFEKQGLRSVFNQTFMYEKFHFILFVFFFATMIFAICRGFYLWASFLFIANLIYNIYPILLQQSIRNRLERILGRASRKLS